MSVDKSDLLVAIVVAAAPAGFAKMAEAGVRAAPFLGMPAVVGLATAMLLADEKRADLSASIGKVLESGSRNLEKAQTSALGRSASFLRDTDTGRTLTSAGGKVLTGLSLLALLNPLAGAARAGTMAALRKAVTLIGANLAKAGGYAAAAGLATTAALKPQAGFKAYLSNVFNPEGNARELLKLDKWKGTVDALDGLRGHANEMFRGKLPDVPNPYEDVVMKASQFAEDAAGDATVSQLIRAIQSSGRPDAVRDLTALQSAIGMTPTSAHLASVFGVALVARLVAKYMGAGPVGRALFSMAAGLGLTRSPGAIPGSSMMRI